MNLLSLLGCLFLVAAAPSQAQKAGDSDVIDIPFTRYVLDNGLTLLVHVDKKAPVVAVNMWYDVGSADEKPGKTGFAHLFEHLMFNGSENYNDDYFKPFDRVGATGMNGTTNFDRTNYFQVVPKTALDMALWMESDRMGHMLGAVDQDKLDEQRGVVQNEKRQGENRPYGKVFLTVFENMYPDGHPYDHSVIGSLEDLDAASLDDVHEWFKRYYGAANTVIAIAGDVEPEDVKARVEKYFGDIAAGPPLIKPAVAVEKRAQTTRMTMEDRVPQARVYKVWAVAPFGDPDLEYLDMAGDVLATGKNSRLYKRLVYEDQIATDVVAGVFGRELGGLFFVWATAQPGQDLGEVERVLDEEMARFLKDGPSKLEMERSRTGKQAAFLRGAERIGGFGGKSDILASGEIYYGDAGAYKTVQQTINSATSKDIRAAARRWLSEGEFVLEVHPFADYKVAESSVDRSAGVPQVGEFPEGRFPDRETATLSNGMKVVLANRTTVPLVEMSLMLNAGYAADQFGKMGTADLAMAMLDEGTSSRSALEISDERERLGAQLGTGSNLDLSYVGLSALKKNLDRSLDLYADVILNPSFPGKEFDRLKKQQLAAIKREKTQPRTMGIRVLPRLMYGEGHAYAQPLTGSGTEESVQSMTVDELKAFHTTWFKPNNATLVVVGDVTMAELKPKLEKQFGDWKAGDVPSKNLGDVSLPESTEVYIIDRPDSEQSIIFAGHLVPPITDEKQLAIEAMNDILGGSFTARINMNLREDKHWSYGARSFILDTAAQRPFIAQAPVQTDKTAESIAEINKEISGIRSDAMPPTEEELAKIKDKKTLTLPGRWETNDAVRGDILEMQRFGLPDDYWATYAGTVRALTLADVSAQAERV
ncbi:MAG: insulinase family protein, partial [Gammaproteobacteria bacterium]|nr:insulinase family protein [Gammaproteobacteria bacterium]